MNPRWLAFLRLSLLLMLVCAAAAEEKVTVPAAIVAYPEMILYNGRIVTMDDTSQGPSPGHIYRAIAIRERRIQALGSDAEILSYAGLKTDKVDLKGRTVIPGIVDAHTHIHNNELDWWTHEHPEAFETLARKFVVGGATYDELRRGIELVLKERMAGGPPNQWAFIELPQSDPKNPGTGTGLGVHYLSERQITIKDLDALSPNHPVMLEAHPSRMVNDAAKKDLERIYGFFHDSRVDETGYGNLIEYSRSLPVDGYFRFRPNGTRELADILEQGLVKNAAVGITTFVSHMMGMQFFDAYLVLAREDRMPIRFGYTNYFGFETSDNPEVFYRGLGDQAGLGTDYLWSAGTGLGNMDSIPPQFCLSIKTPANRENCYNKPDSPMAKATITAILGKQRLAAGHNWGDKALDYFFSYIDAAMKQDPSITMDYIRSRRFSADHCGFYPSPSQIPRVAQYGMYISCAGNTISRSYPLLKQVGMQYANWIAPVNSMLKAGVRVVAENEAGVRGNQSGTYFNEPWHLVTRKNEYGVIVAPEEGVDRMTLMKMMTAWPAEYALREKSVGTLEPGKLADVVVLNKDYFTVPDSEAVGIYPVMTIVGGKIEVIRNEYAQELGRTPVGPQLEFKNELRVNRTDY